MKLYLFEPPVAVGDLKIAGKKVFPFLIILTDDLVSPWWDEDHSPPLLVYDEVCVAGSLTSLVAYFLFGFRTK